MCNESSDFLLFPIFLFLINYVFYVPMWLNFNKFTFKKT